MAEEATYPQSLLKFSHDGMSCEITKLMQIPMNTLCYLIKLVSLFPSHVIYSPFVALSIFATLSNFYRIIKLLPSWGFGLSFIGVYISLMISQDIPSCETFSRDVKARTKIGLISCRSSLIKLFSDKEMVTRCLDKRKAVDNTYSGFTIAPTHHAGAVWNRPFFHKLCCFLP